MTQYDFSSFQRIEAQGKLWQSMDCLSTLNLGYYNGCWYFKHFHQVCECISLLSENIFLSKLKRYFDGRPLNSGKSVAKLAADAGGLPSLSPPSLSPAQNCISATIMNYLGIYFYLLIENIFLSGPRVLLAFPLPFLLSDRRLKTCRAHVNAINWVGGKVMNRSPVNFGCVWVGRFLVNRTIVPDNIWQI